MFIEKGEATRATVMVLATGIAGCDAPKGLGDMYNEGLSQKGPLRQTLWRRMGEAARKDLKSLSRDRQEEGGFNTRRSNEVVVCNYAD